MSYRFVDSFRAGPRWSSSRNSIIRNLLNVHSTMVYVIQVCRQLSSRTRMEFQPEFHHQEFIQCTLNNGICHTGL